MTGLALNFFTFLLIPECTQSPGVIPCSSLLVTVCTGSEFGEDRRGRWLYKVQIA